MSHVAESSIQEAVLEWGAEQQARLRDHPSLRDLESYSRGALPEHRREEFGEHLSLCEDCCDLLRFAVLPPPEETGVQDSYEPEINRAWNALRSHLDIDSGTETPLASLVSGGLRSLSERTLLALCAARALAEVHRIGHIPRDLRLETILVDPDGGIRFLDVGAAGAPEGRDVGYGITAEEFVINLYRGASPEQLSGKTLDERSNLFSFGVVLYELLTGVSPFSGPTPMHTASRVVSLDPAPVRELNPEVGEPLAALVEGLLAKDPDQRPQTAIEVVDILETLVSEPSSSRPSAAADKVDEISALYDEISRLMRAQEAGEQAAETRLEETLSRLRVLQKAEADTFRESFEANLDLPIDAGQKILSRAQALREELEGLTASHSATR